MIYGEFSAAIVNNQVILLNESEAANMHAHLRDLASVTQALARLNTHFIGTYNKTFVKSLIVQIFII